MNKFSWYDATSIEEALAQVNATVSEVLAKNPDESAVIKSGGIDLLDLMKEGLVTPSKVVNIRNIQGLDKIIFDKKEGLRIGANATLAQLAENAQVKEYYLALHQAAIDAATPQLRNMASIGGNLAQRTRCWYFRSLEHECFRKGSGTCFARYGEHEYHAIMKNGACTSVHSSSVSTALMAFNAKVEITNASKGKTLVNMDDFFVLPGDDSRKETILAADDLITSIVIPLQKKSSSFYIKQGSRESHDWPIADVAVNMVMSGTKCKQARVVLGAAAPVPFLSEDTMNVLTGHEINEDIAIKAADASMKKATPLKNNKYKVAIFKTIVKRAILNAVNHE
jgi:xanthine dehydrogenase YagS FAD-binding subunit